jgi:hypothetical protein
MNDSKAPTQNPTTATESTTSTESTESTDKAGVTGLVTALVDDLKARRAARARRRELIRELATYTSAADQADLEATLARHSDEETMEIRALLSIAQHRAA